MSGGGGYRPCEISESARFPVSSVRVESISTARTVRITAVAGRKGFWMTRPAECTRSDRIIAPFPGIGAFATEAGAQRTLPIAGPSVGNLLAGNFGMSRSGERSRAG